MSEYLLSPCKELTPPVDGSFSTIVGELGYTVQYYRVCSSKQEALVSVIKDLQEYIAN